MNQPPLVVERSYNAPVARVWQAITDKDQMKSWYFDLPDFRPEVGFEFQFSAGNDGKQYLHRCRITEVIPGQKLSYTWGYEGLPGSSEVSFELFAEGDQTRLRISHSGLESFPGTENPDFAVSSFTAGWNHILGTSLKAYLEEV